MEDKKMQDLSKEIPFCQLAIIGTRGTENMCKRIQNYINEWRKDSVSYIIDAQFPRFGTGEAKCLLTESVRGKDVFIVADCFNYSQTYKMYGMTVPMSPDDHYQDVKRIISAISGKASRISVIMPMLYESRQHRRTARESLDCAFMLHELISLGVENVMTFDAHDDRVRNAIPLEGFDNLMPTYQMIKAFMANAKEAEEVIGISEQKGIFLAEAIWTRYMPFQRTVREIVDGGAIGKPMILSAHLGYPVSGKERIMRPELGGGALLDLGVYALNFAMMMFGNDIADIVSSCTKADTGIDLQNSITLKYSDGRIADLHSTAVCASDRQGIVCGDKGYIICDNINNMLKADLYDSNHSLVRTYRAPQQITGFEYQVQACIDAIAQGKVETPYMPHSETLKVMHIMDDLRQSWGVVFPNDSMTV